jgi:hypothetical protein
MRSRLMQYCSGPPMQNHSGVDMTENNEQPSRTVWNKLRINSQEITLEPLPRRWVDSIHHLDEQERKRSDDQRGDPPRSFP